MADGYGTYLRWQHKQRTKRGAKDAKASLGKHRGWFGEGRWSQIQGNGAALHRRSGWFCSGFLSDLYCCLKKSTKLKKNRDNPGETVNMTMLMLLNIWSRRGTAFLHQMFSHSHAGCSVIIASRNPATAQCVVHFTHVTSCWGLVALFNVER